MNCSWYPSWISLDNQRIACLGGVQYFHIFCRQHQNSPRLRNFDLMNSTTTEVSTLLTFNMNCCCTSFESRRWPWLQTVFDQQRWVRRRLVRPVPAQRVLSHIGHESVSAAVEVEVEVALVLRGARFLRASEVRRFFAARAHWLIQLRQVELC